MRMTFAFALMTLAACEQVKEAKSFFQARPVDDKTAIEVDTTPRLGAGVTGSVFIDGNKVAAKTPHKEKPLPPGKHTIRIEAKGYISQEMEVDAKEGEVTQISLALKLMPPAPGQKSTQTNGGQPSSGGGKKKGGKVEKEEEDKEEAAEPASHITKTLLVTTTPAQPVFLDGASVGNGTGLRLEVARTTGELRLGDGITFTYSNKRTGVRMQMKDLGDRSVVVDGNAITAKKSIEIDTRPRRIEITDIEGKRIVALMKIVE